MSTDLEDLNERSYTNLIWFYKEDLLKIKSTVPTSEILNLFTSRERTRLRKLGVLEISKKGSNPYYLYSLTPKAEKILEEIVRNERNS